MISLSTVLAMIGSQSPRGHAPWAAGAVGQLEAPRINIDCDLERHLGRRLVEAASDPAS